MNYRFNKLPSFDIMMELAQKNPDALETLRKSMMEDIINSSTTSDSKRRLEGLQFTIDMNRRKAKNPLQCCIKISQLMWDSALTLSEQIEKNI